MTPRRRTALSVAVVLVAAAIGYAAWTQIDGGDRDPIAEAAAERATVAAEPLPTVAPIEIGDVTVETGGAFLGPVVHDVTGRYDWRARIIGGGGWISGVETHPTETNFVIARADNGGAFLWHEDTATWEQLIRHSTMPDPAQGDYEVESIAIPASAANRIYLAVGDNVNASEGRVIRSDDRGATWTASPQLFAIKGNGEERQSGERLVADPTDADVVWFGTRTEGLWVTRDAASTWTKVFQPVVGGEPVGIAWVELGPSGQVYLGVTGIGVLIGSDDGGFEVLVASETIAGDAEIDAQGRLWATDPDAQVVHRYDPQTGEIDSLSPADTRILTVATHPTLASHVVLKNNKVVWTSTDDGETWNARSKTLTCSAPWIEDIFDGGFVTSSPEVDPTNPDRLWSPVGIGVLVTDSGNLWESGDLEFRCELAGIEQMVVNEIVVPAPDAPLSAQWDRAFFSHSAGGLLPPITGPTLRFNAAWDLDISPSDPNVIVATIGDPRNCCRDDESFASVKSLDGGLTWQQFGSHTSGDHPPDLRYGNIAISATDPHNMVWLPTFNRPLHYSRDGGETWTEAVLPGTEDSFDEDGNFIGGSHPRKFLRRHVVAADRIAPTPFTCTTRTWGSCDRSTVARRGCWYPMTYFQRAGQSATSQPTSTSTRSPKGTCTSPRVVCRARSGRSSRASMAVRPGPRSLDFRS